MKAGVNEGIGTIGNLRREKKKSYRDENEKHLPIDKVKFLEPSQQVVPLAIVTFIYSVTAKEEEHGNTNFSKITQVRGRRHVENSEYTFEGAASQAGREKPQMMHEHADNRKALHNLSVFWA